MPHRIPLVDDAKGHHHGFSSRISLPPLKSGTEVVLRENFSAKARAAERVGASPLFFFLEGDGDIGIG